MVTIVKGLSWSFDATIFDAWFGEGDPRNEVTNHSGWTIRSQIRKKVGNVLVANLNVTFPVPTAGTVAIRHDRDFTRSLPVGDYWWSIVATDPSGEDHVYVEPEPIAVHDHPTDPASAVYDFVPGGGGAVHHTHSISDITGLQALLDDRLPPDGGTIARYLRGDNTWQLLNKAAVGLGNVENVTLSTWGGSPAIVQVGTISQGVWQGTRIAPGYLGDGAAIETKFLRGDGTWQEITGSGATAYADLTDAATANLPAINTALSTALAGKAPTSHTHTASQISDSTATGRALLTSTDAAAARTTIGATVTGSALITATNAANARSNALGSGATGDQLFTAATPAAARETLGVIRRVMASDALATSTTPVSAPDLTFPVEAGKLYRVDLNLIVQSLGTVGYQVAMTYPTNARIGQGQALALNNFTVKTPNLGLTSTTLNTNTAGNPNGVTAVSGWVYLRPTVNGNVEFSAAQQTAGTGTVGLLTGSIITVTEI